MRHSACTILHGRLFKIFIVTYYKFEIAINQCETGGDTVLISNEDQDNQQVGR